MMVEAKAVVDAEVGKMLKLLVAPLRVGSLLVEKNASELARSVLKLIELLLAKKNPNNVL